MTEQYVCAFRGRRDAYQVPLALAETGRLDLFITDIYAGPWVHSVTRFVPASVRVKVRSRCEPGIPANRVHSLWATTALEHLRHRLGCEQLVTFNKLDRYFALAAAQRARQTRSDLLLYSSYAWEAFTARYGHTPRKVLFQYHPHPVLERRLLEEDSARYPRVGELHFGAQPGVMAGAAWEREHDAWKHADLVLCASTFTKQSLLEVGADENKIHVVPYGVEVPPAVESQLSGEGFNVLFVGTGSQRKGLHHLLLAWQRATLPAASKLSLVCRTIDPEIEQTALQVPGVEIIRGVDGATLSRLYRSSSLFVMPSLVEGFGQVYLEALSHGCPVLGTSNTGLPDLGGEADGIFVVSPGLIEELSGKLESLSRLLSPGREVRRSALACARRSSWQSFRRGLLQQLGHSVSPLCSAI